MHVIDLEKRRAEKAKEKSEMESDTGPDLDLIEYAEDAEMADIVFRTTDHSLVVMTHPKERKGMHLTPEQATELGLYLVQYAAVCCYTDVVDGSEPD